MVTGVTNQAPMTPAPAPTGFIDRVAHQAAKKNRETAATRMRQAGILAENEEVEGAVMLSRHSSLMDLIAAISFTQRYSWMIVTNRRVLFTRWAQGGKISGPVTTVARPVNMTLADPTKNHVGRNRVILPPEVASVLGGARAYAMSTRAVVEDVFRLARLPDTANLVTPAQSPPSWAQDPSRRHELRYWNGHAWTESVSDHGTITTDALSPPLQR